MLNEKWFFAFLVGTLLSRTSRNQAPETRSAISEIGVAHPKGRSVKKAYSLFRLFDHYLVRLVEFFKIDIDPLLRTDLDLDPGIVGADG